MWTIAVSLFRRDPISSDPRKRQIYQHESYHWGILIVQPEGNLYDAYDATDRNRIDKATFRLENPTGGWWINARQNVDPSASGKLLGYINIGDVPPGMSRDDVKAFLEAVPRPQKDRNPQESCVTWVERVIRAFQEKEGACLQVDVRTFMDWALSHADYLMTKAQTSPDIVNYEDVLAQEAKEGEEKGSS